MPFHKNISRFRSLFCTVLIITLMVGFSAPTFQINVDSTQALGLAEDPMNEKIRAMADSINNLELAIGKPDELQKAKDSLRMAWEDMQTQFSSELSKLKSSNMDPIILERYTDFIKHYEEQILTLNARIDSLITNPANTDELALLEEQLKQFSQKPYKANVENPTPFQVAEHQTLRTLPIEDFPGFSGASPSNFSLINTEQDSNNQTQSLNKTSIHKSAPSLSRSTDYPQPLLDLANELDNDPLQIFNYVYNNIEFIPYYGIKKGSYNTYLERAGNDMDIALLLSDLLEIAGYETNLKQGQVQLTPEQIQTWVGMDDPMAAAEHIVDGYVPMLVYVDDEDALVYTLVEHVWVEAYLPYGDYRGTQGSDLDYQWIPLDASLKRTYSSQEINVPDEMGFDSQDFFDNYLLGNYEGKPFEAFSAEVESYIEANLENRTLENALAELTFDDHNFEFLPNTLPYPVVEELGTFDDVPEELYHNIQYKILDEDDATLLDETFTVEELANKQVVLGYEAASEADQEVIDLYGTIYLTPPYLIELKPVIRINGEVAVTGETVSAAESLDFEMHFLMPEHFFTEEVTETERELIELNVNAGNDVAIAMNTDNLVYPEIYPEAVESTEFLSDQKLYRTALNYLARMADNQQEIATIMGGSFTNVGTRAFVFNGVDIEYVSGVPQTFEWKGLRLDSSSLVNYYSYFGDIDTHRKDFELLFGLEASLDESSIFEEDFDVEAMSTVKGLKMINQGLIPGISMVTIDSSNISVLDGLDISDEVKTLMRDDINAGYIIYTADQSFTYLDWTGLVYITLDPVTGDGGYIIGEGLNGGYTVEEFTGTWDIFFWNSLGTITAEIRAPVDGDIYATGRCVEYEIYYEVSYLYFFTHSWTESGCIDTTGFADGAYTIYNGYGTDETVTFTLETSGSDFENSFNQSLRFPKCDSIDGDYITPYEFPCENGRRQDGIYYDIEMIVIHYTAGSTVQDAYNRWVTDKAASAHYIVNRDGQIYHIIDDEDEAYHVVRDSQAVNARSIGIEIVNEGYDRWYTWFDDSEVYEWNGHDTWQIYPDLQYQAVKELVQYLTEKHGIPEVIFREEYENGPINFIDDIIGDAAADTLVSSFQGVVGHSALQGETDETEEKFDPGPLFDFNSLFTD